MKLSYKAIEKDGKTVQGILDAHDVEETVQYLRSKNLLPVQVVPIQQTNLFDLFSFFNKVKRSDVIFLTQQLSSMLSAGLTLLQALQILKKQVESDSVQSLLTSIITDIQEGKSFSFALSKYPNVFSPVYISLIKASETSGLLDKALSRLSSNLEKQQQLSGTIKGALTYPVIVIVGMITVITILMVVVVPQLSSLYKGLNVELPLTTKIVIGMSNFVVTFWPLLVGGLFLGIFALNRWKKTQSGTLLLDQFILKIPIFGKLMQQMILTEVSRTLGILIGSGALVVGSLKDISDIAGNAIYRNAFLEIARRVEKGISIGESLMYSSLFPPLFIEMIKIGEQTGKLDESLLKISEYFEREVNQTVKTLTTALEPLILVVLGVSVGFLLLAVITPFYNITNSIK